MNYFNITKKSKFMKQSETFSLRSFFEHIYLVTFICSHMSSDCSSSKYSLSEVTLFQFSYLKRKGSHIKNLRDVIEGFSFFLSYSMIKSLHEDKTPFHRESTVEQVEAGSMLYPGW